VIVPLTLATYVVAWLLAVPALVPFLNAGPAWWLMARALRRQNIGAAIRTMLLWAATMAVAATTMSAAGWAARRGGGDLFLQSDYRAQMLHWVRTGEGPESEPATFIPRHLGNAAVFTATSLATAGALSMPMGAVLMNSMGDYVGSLARSGARPWTLAVLGWHPWAVIRIAAFVILGVVLSGPLLGRLLSFEFSLASGRRWMAAGAVLLVLDIALKWALAPAWGRLLRAIAGW